MKCNRVLQRGPQPGTVHTACPNEAEDEVLVIYNQIPYIVPMCTFHEREFRNTAAAKRAARNLANKKAAQRHQPRPNRARG
jgi:predicted DNA-binding WGR domain protein